MFLQGNINKNMKLSAEDMFEKLKNMSDDGEIEKETYQIKSRISRFNQQYKKEAAIRASSSLTSTNN